MSLSGITLALVLRNILQNNPPPSPNDVRDARAFPPHSHIAITHCSTRCISGSGYLKSL
jgi:hypothetical protein